MPLMISSTISVPTIAFIDRALAAAQADAAEHAAVSTVTSSPTPMSPPAVARREAKKMPPTAVSMPLAT